MSEAKERLERLEATTDWKELVRLALADPPEPAPLFHALRDWQDTFAVAYGGQPLESDYPPAVDGFIRRIAFCNVPEPFHTFVDKFVAEHGRRPGKADFPPDLLPFVAMLERPMRRPRCDTKRLRDAARGWLGCIALHVYEGNRDLYRALKRQPAVTLTDFDHQTAATTTPSDLAEVKIADRLGKSTDDVRDILNAARTAKRRSRK